MVNYYSLAIKNTFIFIFQTTFVNINQTNKSHTRNNGND